MPELLLSYYGDDLTGSTDVMEALASRGVPTVLFTQSPTPEQRARFGDVRAIGLAGSSRSTAATGAAAPSSAQLNPPNAIIETPTALWT